MCTNSPAFANNAPTVSSKQLLRHNSSRSHNKEKEELPSITTNPLAGQQFPDSVRVGQYQFVVSSGRSKEAKDLSDKASSSPNGSSSYDSSSSGDEDSGSSQNSTSQHNMPLYNMSQQSHTLRYENGLFTQVDPL